MKLRDKEKSKNAFSTMMQFVKVDLWRIRSKELSKWWRLGVRALRIAILSMRGLFEDRLQLRASALTFYSLLSVVPIAAMLFGIAKGFGFETSLEKQVMANLEGHEEIASRIIQFSHSLLDNTKGGVIAGIGLVLLLWTIIKVFGNIEDAFNDIWGVKKGRSFGKKVTDYLSLMLICPMLFITSSTVNVVITSQLKVLVHKIALLGSVGPFIFAMLKLLPYAAIWALFTFVYIFMPHTKVRFVSGALAGIVAGAMYQIFQWIYIYFQIGVARYNAIYGSFAALPLFLMWLQLSWVIVLMGAEMAFAYQNVDTYEFEPDCLKVSPSFKRLLSLSIIHLIIKTFSDGREISNVTKIAQQLEIPIRLVRQILSELRDSNLVSQVAAEDQVEASYHPACDPGVMTIKFVLDALDNRGSDDIPVAESEEIEKLKQSLRDFDRAIANSPGNLLLREI
jgi:membrane protein